MQKYTADLMSTNDWGSTFSSPCGKRPVFGSRSLAENSDDPSHSSPNTRTGSGVLMLWNSSRSRGLWRPIHSSFFAHFLPVRAQIPGNQPPTADLGAIRLLRIRSTSAATRASLSLANWRTRWPSRFSTMLLSPALMRCIRDCPRRPNSESRAGLRTRRQPLRGGHGFDGHRAIDL